MAAETQIIPIRDDRPTPMNVIQLAISQGADVERLTKLFELQERWEANEARKAFNVAMAEFKAEAIKLVRTKAITDGPLKGKKHVELGEVVRVVTPALSQHGLSISWKLSKDAPEWMEVTCTLRHIEGHTESVSMGAAPDTGPGRNAIQARGSAKTYLERYTATAILGLAPEEDDDGHATSKAPETRMPEEKAQEWVEAIRDAGSFDELKDIYSKAQKAAQTFGDTDALRKFGEAKNEQYRKLARGAK